MAAKTSDPPPPYPGTGVSSSAPEPSQPCPNGCETGALSKGQLREHLQDCPLQLVECEFANAGCNVKVPRKDLAKHMTENAQHHLMSATLLNLRLTKELHQKMEEKDRQIAHLQRQVETLSTMNGFICHDLVLTNFKAHQKRSAAGEWYSKIVGDSVGIVKVQLKIDTNGAIRKFEYMSASLNYIECSLPPEISGVARLILSLHMLNQLGDYGHYVITDDDSSIQHHTTKWISKEKYMIQKNKYFPKADLGYNSANQTQYLVNDTIHFKLYLKVELSADFPRHR